MFDLNKSLSAWRSAYAKRRAFSTEDLDELEAHVRDQVLELTAEGLTEQEAFEHAMSEMGNWENAEREYAKVFWQKIWRAHRFSEEMRWRFSLLHSYLTVALRTIAKQKVYAFINVFGLTIGLASFMLIMLFVHHEFSYDKFHQNSERLFRVIASQSGEVHIGSDQWAVTPAPLANMLEEEFPEISKATTIDDFRAGKALLSHGQQNYWEPGFWGDKDFFTLFTYQFRHGTPEHALQEPTGIVLTASLSNKIFGTENPIGQVLTLNDRVTLEVTGVIEDVPETSSFKFSFVASLASQDHYARSLAGNDWNNSSWQTFFLIKDPSQAEFLTAKLNRALVNHLPPTSQNRNRVTYHIQSLHDVHLYSNYNGEKAFTGDISRIYIFLAIAFVILALAAMNYINLAVARSSYRIREIGLRKAIGAEKKQLFFQFLGESMLLITLAFILAIVIVVVLDAPFSQLVQRPLDVSSLLEVDLLIPLMLSSLFLGLLSGIYPAIYMASLNPASILKGSKTSKRGNSTLQKYLIMGQYAASVVLVICGLTIYQQLQFVQEADPGYAKESLVIIPIRDDKLGENFEALRNQWRAIPGVEGVTYTGQLPTSINSSTTIINWSGSTQNARMSIYEAAVHEDFLEVFNLKLAAGRMFTTSNSDLNSSEYLINEKAASLLGWTPEEALGKTFVHNGTPRSIIGVLEDFHIHSMHLAIEPFMIRPTAVSTGYLVVKLNTSSLSTTFDQLSNAASVFTPFPIEPQFLSEQFEGLYAQEANLGTTIGFFTLLALLISSLGLFGLAAYAAEQRTKEIGIRKALGASISNINYMLSRDFSVLVLIASVAALPIGYLIMQRWLENFAYHVQQEPIIFISTPLIVLVIALISVSYQSTKAARQNPVHSLRP